MKGRIPWALLILLGGVALRIFMLPGPREAARGEPSTPPSAAALNAGYETEDISARDMGFIFATIAVVVFLLVGGVFIFINRMGAADHQRFVNRNEVPAAFYAPAGPLLQIQPRGDYAAYLRSQQIQLNQYGWENAAHSVAHIPVSRAMALVVGHSLDAPR